MDGLRLAALLIYTFGVAAYGAILWLWIQEVSHRRWAGGRRAQTQTNEVDAVNGVLIAITFVWFALNLAQVLTRLSLARGVWPIDVPIVFIAFAFPPLIAHVTAAEVAASGPGRVSRVARAAIGAAYVVSLGIPTAFTAAYVWAPNSWFVRVAGPFLGVALSAAFIAASAYSSVLINRDRGHQPREERQSRRSLTAMFGLMALIFVVIGAVSMIAGQRNQPMRAPGFVLELFARSLPLLFMFVSAYVENRFYFFDLFIKRGAAFVVSIAGLTLWLAVVLPVLRPLGPAWAAPWLFAVALLPVVVLLPWLHARVGALLDRRWLGRTFTTQGAVAHFVAALRSATTADDAIRHAERTLSEIFGASITIALPAGSDGADAAIQHRVPIGRDGAHGTILLGRRAIDAPYFSEDRSLVASLADILAAALENLTLQQQRQEDARRAADLSLHASRSELKALRAQINPHFLFNALNAIAGLIHRHPERADRTIEQLAEVFRYALRGSDSEWTTVGNEMDFIRAYLDVEHARFGDRLAVDLDLDVSAQDAKVPAMMLQTLVENAVKHGLGDVLGRALVRVHASAAHGRLTLSVTDNGPGFRDQSLPLLDASASRGYGLVNIRQRLVGYFGEAAALSIDRRHGLTTVSIEMPLLQDAPARLHEVAR
jgi:signal transduction histidine kinase